jgi:hypothetical protein
MAQRVACLAMKVFYQPFRIVAGVIGGRLGSKMFHTLWGSIDAAPPPAAEAGDAPLGKVVAAAALEAATMAAIGAVVNRAAARTFHGLIGAWPGKTRAEKAAEED